MKEWGEGLTMSEQKRDGWGTEPSTAYLGSGLHSIVLSLHLLLGIFIHTGVPDPVEQGACLLQQPIQEHSLIVHIMQQHLGVAQLPLLLLQAQLKLHRGLQSDHHLLEPAVKLIPGQQILAPMQPHPLDAAVGEMEGLRGMPPAPGYRNPVAAGWWWRMP